MLKEINRKHFLKLTSSAVLFTITPKAVKGAVKFLTQDGITIQNPYNGYELELESGINDQNKDDIRYIKDTLVVESDKPIVIDPPQGNTPNFTIDSLVEPQGNNIYHVHLKMQTGDSQSQEDVVMNIKYDPSVGVNDVKGSPKDYKLYNNFPNPVNPNTTLRYEISKSGNVKIEIFDILGKSKAKLNQGYVSAGVHDVNFNANGLSSGTYIYRLVVDGKPIAQNKMQVVK